MKALSALLINAYRPSKIDLYISDRDDLRLFK